MTQAVAEDTETSLTEGMESMGVREADKTEKVNQGEEEKETQNDKMGEANETVEETEKEDEEDKDKDAAEDGQKDGVKSEMDMEVGKAEEQKGEDDWEIPYSDEEMEEAKSWMPPPQEIKRLYELLAKGEVLELNWVGLPRRAPTPPRTPSPERDGDDSQEPKEEENQNRSLTPTEFDFDEEQTPKNTFINRRRTPGSSARSSVRREARMDKVLSDIKRHRRIDEQLLRSGRDLFKSDKPRSAAVPKEPLSPNSQRERQRDSDPSTVFSPRQRRY